MGDDSKRDKSDLIEMFYRIKMTNNKWSPSSEKASLLREGLTMRSTVTDCPLGAFKVIVTRCSGQGECAKVCIVNALGTGQDGKCVVINDALCFGCTACLAQCQENGVTILHNESHERMSIKDLLQ